MAESTTGTRPTTLEVTPGVGSLRPEDGPLFVVVGVFDGIHRGHGYLLRHLVRQSIARGARPAVITFDHHPDEIITGSAPPLILDPEERLTRLAAARVEVVVVQTFDADLRMTPYDAFVRMITDRTRLDGFLMTPDAAFGHERRGTPETLAALGATAEPGFEVVVVPPYELDGRQVRSQDIRAAVARGDLARAKRLLGRHYAVTGTPGPGASGADSRTLTFPMPVALPPAGTYPVAVSGVFRLGWRPGRSIPGEAVVGPDRGLRIATSEGQPPSDRRLRIRFL